MKRLLAAVFVGISFPAWAQQPPPQEFTIRLTLPELQLIGTALTKRPYEDVAPLLAKLNEQVAAQQKAATPPVEPGK